jgi:hypothetical protein
MGIVVGWICEIDGTAEEKAVRAVLEASITVAEFEL